MYVSLIALGTIKLALSYNLFSSLLYLSAAELLYIKEQHKEIISYYALSSLCRLVTRLENKQANSFSYYVIFHK